MNTFIHLSIMLAPTLAFSFPDEKTIDAELRDSYEKILHAINAEVNQQEKMFRSAQMKYAHAKTKEDTLQALDDMTTHAVVHDTLEGDWKVINDKLCAIMRKYWPKEEEAEEPNEDYDRYFLE